MDFFARILIKDHLLHEGFIKRLTGEVLWELWDLELFLRFGRVNLRGGLNINFGLRGLGNTQ